MHVVTERPAVVLARVPAFARWPVLAVAAVTVAAHVGASVAGRGYWFDEALMLAIGRYHLDWGSVDQPPVGPLLAALADAVAPGSVLVLRIPALLVTGAAVVVAALIARELGGDRRAQLLTAGAQATSVWMALAGHWLTPYGLEPVEWLLVAWLLVRWVRTRDDRLLLWLGLVVGVAAETKFQVLLLSTVLLIAVLVAGPRELLGRPLLWAGAGIAALIAAPTLVWQAVNGWPQLQMSSVLDAEAEALYGGRPAVAVVLVVTAGLAGTVLAVYGTVRLLRAPEMRPWLFLGLTAVTLWVVFVAVAGRPYYLQSLHGLVAAFGAVGLQRRREAGGRRLRAWPAYLVSAVLAGLALWLSVPSVASQAQVEIGSGVTAAYRALPADVRDRTAVFGESYLYGVYLDVWPDRAGMPPAYSGSRSYGWFPPPPDRLDTVLYVGNDPSSLRPWFGDARPIGTVGGVDPTDSGAPARLWLLTGKRAPWERIWPSVRTLTVAVSG